MSKIWSIGIRIKIAADNPSQAVAGLRAKFGDDIEGCVRDISETHVPDTAIDLDAWDEIARTRTR